MYTIATLVQSVYVKPKLKVYISAGEREIYVAQNMLKSNGYSWRIKNIFGPAIRFIPRFYSKFFELCTRVGKIVERIHIVGAPNKKVVLHAKLQRTFCGRIFSLPYTLARQNFLLEARARVIDRVKVFLPLPWLLRRCRQKNFTS